MIWWDRYLACLCIDIQRSIEYDIGEPEEQGEEAEKDK